jgi:hypothetical protein
MKTYTQQDLINFFNLLSDNGIKHIDESNQEKVLNYYNGLMTNDDPLEEFYKTFDIKNILPQKITLDTSEAT